MQCCWTVVAAPHICVYITFLVMSFVVALCWSSKDYWCLKEVPARSFLVIGKMSVIITIVIWCWPRIRFMTFFSVMHWCRNIWLQIEGKQQAPSCSVTALELWHVYVPYRSMSVYFSADFNFIISLFICIYLCCSMYCLFCVILCTVCKCVLYHCRRVTTQLQLTNISILLHIKKTEKLWTVTKKVYSTLKFTVVCHVIVLLLAVLQWH